MLFKTPNRRRSDEGFTLIELLVVVVILGILIGIAIPVYLNYRQSANDSAAESDLRNAVSTLEVCNSDGGYPTAVAADGTMQNCDSQELRRSDGTNFRYAPSPAGAAAGAVTSYVMFSENDGGSGNIYCYDSATGGSVQDATGATLAAATC